MTSTTLKRVCATHSNNDHNHHKIQLWNNEAHYFLFWMPRLIKGTAPPIDGNLIRCKLDWSATHWKFRAIVRADADPPTRFYQNTAGDILYACYGVTSARSSLPVTRVTCVCFATFCKYLGKTCTLYAHIYLVLQWVGSRFYLKTTKTYK